MELSELSMLLYTCRPRRRIGYNGLSTTNNWYRWCIVKRFNRTILFFKTNFIKICYLILFLLFYNRVFISKHINILYQKVIISYPLKRTNTRRKKNQSFRRFESHTNKNTACFAIHVSSNANLCHDLIWIVDCQMYYITDIFLIYTCLNQYNQRINLYNYQKNYVTNDTLERPEFED
jgi:hypothetical protein